MLPRSRNFFMTNDKTAFTPLRFVKRLNLRKLSSVRSPGGEGMRLVSKFLSFPFFFVPPRDKLSTHSASESECWWNIDWWISLIYELSRIQVMGMEIANCLWMKTLNGAREKILSPLGDDSALPTNDKSKTTCPRFPCVPLLLLVSDDFSYFHPCLTICFSVVSGRGK